MERKRIQELHFITAIANLPSIARLGILSHNRCQRIPHISIAMEEIQDRRVGKVVPNGRPLHDYANLFFDARNSMMYRRQNERDDLVVVRVDSAVLELPEVVITDGNAASNGTRFLPSPSGLVELDEALVFARSWNDSDLWAKIERKRARSAEVLVPDVVHPGYISSCYAHSRDSAALCTAAVTEWTVEVKGDVFFR